MTKNAYKQQSKKAFESIRNDDAGEERKIDRSPGREARGGEGATNKHASFYAVPSRYMELKG
jgi:hypothetical protein